jgi:ketosteroid isomerase-like protein
MKTDKSTAENSIREARERYNAAIANRDADAIASVLCPNYHVVTGRSDQFHGIEEQRRRWADLFQKDPALIFCRTPREIRINEAWGLAEELGNWTGNSRSGALAVKTSGVYAAKWQRTTDGTWLVQTEVFTTLECSGPTSGCIGPDPINLPSEAF